MRLRRPRFSDELTIRRRRRLRYSDGGAIATVPPTITSVSQNEGTIDGGSVINIVGTNFVSGMTSNLGAVSAITGTTATITTNAHAAGAFAWHVSTINGSSTSQTFTYLAHPTLATLTPNNGPATLANAGVLFTGTNFPALGSGVPIGGTVGVGAISGATLIGSTTLDANFAAPGVGSLTASLTVDGVAAVHANAFTGNPPPHLDNATTVPTTGGQSRVMGNTLIAGCTCTIAGVSVPVTFVSSTQIDVDAPAHAAATVSISVTNPDGQVSTMPHGFTYSNTQTPDVILTTTLVGWYRADTTTGSAPVTSWNDKSGTGNNLPATGTPTVNASDPNWNGEPSISLNGSTDLFSIATFNLAGGTSFFAYAFFRQTGAAPTEATIAMLNITNVLEFRLHSGAPEVGKNTETATWGASVNATNCAAYGYATPSGGNMNLGVNVNIGSAEVDASGADTHAIGNALLSVGGRIAPSQLFTGQLVEIIIANAIPTPTQITELFQYANTRYAINPAPSVLQTTNVGLAGGGFTVGGLAFLNGASVVVGGGVGALATQFISPTSLRVTGMPASAGGTYDVTVINPDTNQNTLVGGLLVTSVDDVMTIAGAQCVSWGRGDSVTVVAGKVTSVADKSLTGNIFAEATSPPTFQASNANFGGQPGWLFVAASTTRLTCPSLNLVAATPAIFGWFVARQIGTTNFSSYFWCDDGSGGTWIRASGTSGKPELFSHFTDLVWGTSQANNPITVFGGDPGLTGGTALLLNVQNGAQITATLTPGSLNSNVDAYLGIGSLGTSSPADMEMVEYGIFSAPLSAPQQTRLQAYVHARYGI